MVDHQVIQLHQIMEALVVLVVVEVVDPLPMLLHLVEQEIHLLLLHLKEVTEELVKDLFLDLIAVAEEEEQLL